jgi:hypothetical protein
MSEVCFRSALCFAIYPFPCFSFYPLPNPHQHVAVFIDRQLLPCDEFELEVFESVVLQMKLALERTIRDPPLALESGARLFDHFGKLHAVFYCVDGLFSRCASPRTQIPQESGLLSVPAFPQEASLSRMYALYRSRTRKRLFP